MWRDTLARFLQALDPAIGEIEQLRQIRAEIRARMGRFVNLAVGDDATAFFASELTREHLREVVRLFIAAEPSFISSQGPLPIEWVSVLTGARGLWGEDLRRAMLDYNHMIGVKMVGEMLPNQATA